MSQPGMGLIAEAEAEASGRDASTSEVVVDYRPIAPKKSAPRVHWRTVANAACVPVMAAAALALHYAMPDRGPVIKTSTYVGVLVTILVMGVLAIALRWVSPAVHRWVSARLPLFAGALGVLCVWDLVTAKL